MTSLAHNVASGVVGADSSGRAVFNRLEIVPFMANPMQFSLYVQALVRMMQEDTASWTSYYQIAGIHGAPYTPYDGAGATFVRPLPEFMGYCSHSSVLFPTWHRPYMALIEQEIQRIALTIASQYSNFNDQWIEAAVQLRHPYWDWSKTAQPPHELYADEELDVLLPPLGKPGKISNPFRRYVFQRPTPNFPSPFSEHGWYSTHRHAMTDASNNIVDDIPDLEATLSDQAFRIRMIGTSLLLIGDTASTWEAFSNDNKGLLPQPADTSLEALHGNIHMHVGGGSDRGHMSNPVVAAFDPFFWLHHSQTDRLLSLWAALHPDQWVTPSREPEGTWTITTRGAVDETTSLTPFYCGTSDGQFWTSADLRAPTDGLFGYSYEEFDGVDWSDKVAVQAHIKTKVAQLYPLSTIIATWMDFDGGASHPLCPRLAVAQPTARASFSPDQPRGVLRWTAHITAKKHALGGSFTVLVFLGAAPAHPKNFLSSANFVGDYCAFVNPTPERCENCVQQGNIAVGGAVDLTDALVRRAEVMSLHPRDVVPYLREMLCWRVWTGTGPPAHPSEVEELEVDVSATPLYIDEHSEITAGNTVVYHDVTRGSPGGCRHPERPTNA
ncbi:Di-copper centre-containing protein [Trametes gibbosa]|nr:Di-copper centre-containing protein [Trametes gibbosa]